MYHDEKVQVSKTSYLLPSLIFFMKNGSSTILLNLLLNKIILTTEMTTPIIKNKLFTPTFLLNITIFSAKYSNKNLNIFHLVCAFNK